MRDSVKGIGMISGGLDSLLAAAVLKDQGIPVAGLHFLNGYGARSMKERVEEGLSMADIAARRKELLEERAGIPIDVIDVSEEFMTVLERPKHGFGKNINPCIDCRIFLLRKAAAMMEAAGAGFIFTGEVLGQRPMSQHLKSMKIVEKESGLEGRLLRPLSAKLLEPTIPEIDGVVDRERLLDIQGRSRKRQIALASQLGIDDYPAPAGGCMLTDENYARRFGEMKQFMGEKGMGTSEMLLLSVGRHFRLPSGLRIVVGRYDSENYYLERSWSGFWLATTPDHPGPVTLVLGDPESGDLEKVAAITARYSDGKKEDKVKVSFVRGEDSVVLEVRPAEESGLSGWRI